MKKLTAGSKAPAFSLPDRDNNKIALKDITTEYIVLYFYPKDSTPGCTIEAQEFNKALSRFTKLNTTVIGISGGNQKTKEKFCSANKLKLTLLSDEDFTVAKKYQSFGPKKFMGRSYEGIERRTFILDQSRQIIKIYDAVKPLGHAKEVLQFLENLSST